MLSKRHVWMFAPLLLVLGLLAAVMFDLRHPASVRHHQCQVLATGVEAGHYRTRNNVLFDQGGPSSADVGFRCRALGVVVVNDATPFALGIRRGSPAVLTHRAYRWWPDTWRVSVGI